MNCLLSPTDIPPFLSLPLLLCGVAQGVVVMTGHCTDNLMVGFTVSGCCVACNCTLVFAFSDWSADWAGEVGGWEAFPESTSGTGPG